jgi:hypothetical protein
MMADYRKTHVSDEVPTCKKIIITRQFLRCVAISANFFVCQTINFKLSSLTVFAQ